MEEFIMKRSTRNCFVILFFVVFSIGLIPTHGLAAGDTWINSAQITEIGPTPDGDRVFIKVISPDEGINEQVSFQLPDSMKKEMMAVALTAMSLGKTIKLRYDSEHTTTWPQPDRFYIND